jgi:hypothetical protein
MTFVIGLLHPAFFSGIRPSSSTFSGLRPSSPAFFGQTFVAIFSDQAFIASLLRQGLRRWTFGVITPMQPSESFKSCQTLFIKKKISASSLLHLNI